nr:nucleotide-binding domain containing protein [Paenibacillus sp. ISL-20]
MPEALSLTSVEEGSQDWAQADKALIVSGSLSQTTRQQLRAVEDMPDSLMLEIDPAALIRETYDTGDVLRQIARDMDKRYLVLYVDASEENRRLAKEAGDERGLSSTEVSEAISLGLGRMTKSILQAYAEVQGLVLTGGDTAKAICMELGMGEMQLYSEVEPGLPFGRLQGMEKGYWTVTKAGGFGNDQSLVDSLHYITNKKKVRT